MRPIELRELKPFETKNKRFWKGTYQTFGFTGWLALTSPLMNFILNFRHRGKTLDIPLSWDTKVTYDE
jgi:hypothetical protein